MEYSCRKTLEERVQTRGDLVWFTVQKWVFCNLKLSRGAAGTAWWMRKPPRLVGWRWAGQGRDAGLSPSLQLQVDCEAERDRACPPLAPGFQAVVQTQHPGTPAQVWARWRFRHRCSPPPSISPDTTDKLTICPLQTHTPGKTLWSSPLFLFHEFETQKAVFTSQLLQSMTNYKGLVSSLAKKKHTLPLLTCITNLLHPLNKNMAQPSPGPEGSTDNAASPLWLLLYLLQVLVF